MGVVGLIPARYGSTRFPGKPLALIAGRPMIEHVWRGARSAASLTDIVVATDDERIRKACEGFGARCVLTRRDHASGSDRLAEACGILDIAPDDIVVNVQGDEPLIEGRVIDAVVSALIASPEAAAATAIHRAEAGIDDPNRVKVVLDQQGYALYFSRSVIPARRSASSSGHWLHIGLYAYTSAFLQEFTSLPRTPAERAEELEQLRILEHGHRIRTAEIADWVSRPVDTPEDCVDVEAYLRA